MARAGAAPGFVENICSTVRSSTASRGVPRVHVRASSARPHPPATERRYDARQLGAFSSQAGLHQRSWTARLLRALERELFVVHYQPIVSLRDREVAHYEALVRLADEPSGELVSPGQFLPVAERSGLICQIDRLVLQQVLALLASPRHPGLRLAVNLSARSVTDPGMLRHVERALARNRVEPDRLVFEVTETDAICDMDRARAFCAGVRALGCEIALDDFGAGFGTFQYLKALPFDYLKIDGSFVRSLPCSPKDQLVVRALAGLAAAMGKRTVAEFVRDEPTAALLCRFGIDQAQGFAFGRPMPAAALLRRERARPPELARAPELPPARAPAPA
jgi:EAL domain-containing protein (putative c-di-GMP-specific phosphodiesterase class I)